MLQRILLMSLLTFAFQGSAFSTTVQPDSQSHADLGLLPSAILMVVNGTLLLASSINYYSEMAHMDGGMITKQHIGILVTSASVLEAASIFTLMRSLLKKQNLIPSEDTFRKANVFIEAGGRGMAYSLNAEYFFFNPIHGFHLGGRIGYGILFLDHPYHSIPFDIVTVYGRSQHKFENSIGYCLEGTSSSYVSIITSGLMYRYQKPNGQFSFRIGLTPRIYLPKFHVLPWTGISFGTAF